MKKLAALVCLVLLCFCCFAPTNLVARAKEVESFEENEYLNIIKEGDLLRFYDRTAGTDGEKSFALFLQNRMIEFGYVPSGSDAENKSFEYFSFSSKVDGLEKVSQNVRFVKKGANSNKKIIICTSYDNAFGFATGNERYSVISDDAGLGKVVCALSIANSLKDINLDYDIEFVFFGAEYHDMAGGKEFALGISQKDANKILLAINIDDISKGQMYYYDAEKQTEYGKAFGEFFAKNFDNSIKKYYAGSSVILQESEAYPFLHRGLMSDNAALIAAGVRVVSVFSAEKSGPFANEYYRNYETTTFDGQSVPDSISISGKVAGCVSSFVASSDIEDVAIGNGKISSFWTNNNIAILICVALVVVVWIIYYFVYNKLLRNLKKTYSTKQVVESLDVLLDGEIEKSSNIEIKENSKQIHDMFAEEIKKRLDDNDSQNREE